MSEQRHGNVSEKSAEDLVATADTGARSPTGFQARLLYAVALCWSLFQLWYASPLPFMLGFLIFNDTHARAIHLSFALFLAFTAFPGIVASGRRFPIFGVIFALGGLGAAYAAVQQGLAGNTNGLLIFGLSAATAFVVAWSASRPTPLDRIPKLDWVMAFAGAVSAGYLFVFYEALAMRPGAPTLADLMIAGMGMVLLLEATRRALGPALTIIASIFLFYTFAGPYMPDLIAHRGASFSRVMSQQWLTAEGVFGIALGVSTSFVFLFVLFGSMLDRAGAGNYFIQVAFALLGHLRGGPAKAAVVASGLTGLISGSSIANTVTTGTFTIPLMKRVGFSSEKAGAVEVASSVNGQIMPPVMGAAAFLMVEYVGIPYVDVIKHAFLPAIISYIALLYIVHLEALKANMQGMERPNPKPLYQSLINFGITVSSIIILAGLVYYGIGWTRDVFGEAATWFVGLGVLVAYVGLVWYAAQVPELKLDDPNAPVLHLPEVAPTVKSGLYYILPVVILIWCLIVERLSPGLSAFYAVVFMIFIMLTQRPLLTLFRKHDSNLGSALVQGFRDLIDGLVTGARNMVGIGVATAAAGIIVGVVAQTGVGQVLTQVIEQVSGGNLIIILVLTALLSLVLGLGLPTTANYIIVASLMAPVIAELGSQQGLVVPLIAVHLFVFYFGIMADVTPPVGLASFAAAAVSRGDPLQTGVQAFYYSMRTVALPFIFIFNYQLLLIGIEGPFQLAIIVISALLAMLVFAAATQGYFYTRSRIYESIALLLVAFTLFRPGFWMDMIEPDYVARPASEIYEIVKEVPNNGFLRLRVAGYDPASFDDIEKTVMLNVGPKAAAQERLMHAGLMVAPMGDAVSITQVIERGDAGRYGIGMGWDINQVLVPNPERPPKELMFIPALLLLGLVYLLQKRRAGATSGSPRRAKA
ncbi:TRAP transporter permease [Aquibaculum arenosum]|uniref:TRAP transporter permease n=1 Tax=Aquibaculum arenosum TaxID=3032591 RepID=A0ABT5YIJ7_9PROT|nr:TRAP transporter permease [Fodinicurvata sp. CAU 1616]MDF2094694.1 TRAP transporter permease [Fodinicurvata sp. CAU 1616]